ncbi:penicillin-binding protein 1A [Thermodesulfobacteriota bacterium]
MAACSFSKQTSRLFLRSLPVLTTLIIGIIGGYIYWCIATLPSIKLLESYEPFKASKLYSHDNELLTQFYIERRSIISHNYIPQHVKNAFIAVEDKRFYSHCGIDVLRIIGALIRDVKSMAFVEGGSTISQQLAKMVFLSPEKTITRKVKEIALSLLLERKYTKDEILGIYLNHAYLGTRAYGIEAASQTYFGKSCTELRVSEAALLATLPRAPSKHSPFKAPHKAEDRRNEAIKRMFDLGFISREQYVQALEEDIPHKLHGRMYKAPFFVDHLRELLEERYGDRLYTTGLKVYSTLDYRMQKIAEQAVAQGIEELGKRGVTGIQAALLAVELKTGRIKAMVGGTNYQESQFNRVTQAMRQPGSAFKPIVYLAALNKGYRPSDIINDERLLYIREEGIWGPQNYDHRYYGQVSLESALTRSLNAATVHLAKKVGIESIIDTARRLGIQSTIHPFDSSALGASELTLMELVYAYTSINQGYRVAPVQVNRIIDREQQTVFEQSSRNDKLFSEDVIAHLKKMLRSVIVDGTGKRAAKLDRVAFGKTGTTNNYADAWFVGFDDAIITGVWVGRDNHKTIGQNETGAKAALPIWLKFMQDISSSSGQKVQVRWSQADVGRN